MGQTDDRTLEQRLQALEDKLAIYELIAAYGHCVDSGSADEARNLFVPDGVIDSRSGPRTREHVADVAAQCGSLARGYAHVAYLPVVVVDGDRATAYSYSNSLDQREGTDEYVVRLAAADCWEFVRIDGRWLIERRTARVLDGSATSKDILARGAAARNH